MNTFTLRTEEKEFLFRQNPAARSDGSWQSLLVKLQDQFYATSMQVTVDDSDLERIPRYAFDYGNGGWEGLTNENYYFNHSRAASHGGARALT